MKCRMCVPFRRHRYFRGLKTQQSETSSQSGILQRRSLLIHNLKSRNTENDNIDIMPHVHIGCIYSREKRGWRGAGWICQNQIYNYYFWTPDYLASRGVVHSQTHAKIVESLHRSHSFYSLRICANLSQAV